jgi:hypothetical protein
MAFLGCSSENENHIAKSNNIELIDSSLIGQTINEAIKILRIDSSEFHIVHEPPMIIRGLSIEESDTCEIRLYVARIMDTARGCDFGGWKMKGFHQIENAKVIGVGWSKPKSGKKNHVGEVIAYYEY